MSTVTTIESSVTSSAGPTTSTVESTTSTLEPTSIAPPTDPARRTGGAPVWVVEPPTEGLQLIGEGWSNRFVGRDVNWYDDNRLVTEISIVNGNPEQLTHGPRDRTPTPTSRSSRSTVSQPSFNPSRTVTTRSRSCSGHPNQISLCTSASEHPRTKRSRSPGPSSPSIKTPGSPSAALRTTGPTDAGASCAELHMPGRVERAS